MELISYGEVERMWKNVIISYLEIIFRHLPRGAEKNHSN
jgi:hypothetical protein